MIHHRPSRSRRRALGRQAVTVAQGRWALAGGPRAMVLTGRSGVANVETGRNGGSVAP